MVNKIIAAIAGSKVGKVFAAVKRFLDGNKTYALGTMTIVQGVVGLWSTLAGLPDVAGLIDLVRHATSNPDVQAIMAGAAMFTVRAAIKKSGAPAAAAPAAQPGTGGNPQG